LRDHKDESASEDLEILPISGGIPRQVRDPRQHAGEALLEQSEADEFAGRVRRAVDALPSRQRAAVLLHKFEEMNYVDVARVMGTSVPTVKSLLWRAYTQLRRDLLPLAEGRAFAVKAAPGRAVEPLDPIWMGAAGIGSPAA
jgi:RNA polymerase sigma-70 factor (ECF subfamily)